MGKTDLADGIDLKAYRRHTFLIDVLLILFCLLGMGGGLRLFMTDIADTRKKLEETPVGFVHNVNGTIQRQSGRFFLADRLGRNSSVFSGDTVNSAVLSGAKINFVNGEIIEVFENTGFRLLNDIEESFGIELHTGEIHVQGGRSDIAVFVSEGAAGLTRSSRIQLAPGSAAEIKADNGVTVKLFTGSGIYSIDRNTSLLAPGEILRVSGDGTVLPSPPVMMLSPRNGSRLLRNVRGKTPVKFQWNNTADSGEVILEISKTGDFSDLTESWRGEEDSAEIELPEGRYFWRIHEPGISAGADSGKLEIVDNPGPRALYPVNGSTVKYSGRNSETLFSWSVSEEADAVLLEVADNPEMYRPYLRQLVNRTDKGSGFFISTTLGEGVWYWRVNPVYPGEVSASETLAVSSGAGYWRIRPAETDSIDDEKPSPVSMFTLVSAPEQAPDLPVYGSVNSESGVNPRLVFPPDNYSIESARTPDFFFSWKSPRGYSARFQLAAEHSDFNGALYLDVPVDLSSIQCPFLLPGTYYWRITGSGPDGQGSSPPIRLVVIPALAAPALESPWENEKLKAEEGKAVTFAWERLSYASFFCFRLFLQGRELPLSEITSLRNNSVMVYFDANTAGQFFWTVQGFSAPTETATTRSGLIAKGHFSMSPQSSSFQDGMAAWSIPRITNIQSYAGDIQSPIRLVSPASGISIPGIQALRSPMTARWNADGPMRNVQLIVSRIPDPLSDSGAIVRNTNQSSATFPSLSEGIWYWTVTGDTSDQRGVTPGDPFWINVLPVSQLPSPAIIQPEDETIIDIARLTADRRVAFGWDEVPGANVYIFSLFRDVDPPILLASQSTENEPGYVLDNLSILNEGNFLWQVEAIYRNENGVVEQRGTIERHTFSVQIQHSTELQPRIQGTMYGQ